MLGPYFFEGNVTGNTYLAMIDNFVVPNIRGRFEERNNGRLARGWWIQDGAPAHASSKSRDSSAERALWKPDSVARARARMATTISRSYAVRYFLVGIDQRPSVQNTSS
jgi:hypothetical protein